MCPVCLPRYNPAAFLHAYVAFLHPGAGLAVALLAAHPDAFEPLAAGRELLEVGLNSEGVTQVRLFRCCIVERSFYTNLEAINLPLGLALSGFFAAREHLKLFDKAATADQI